MKQPTFNGRVLLPIDVIEDDRYIKKICTRTLYDKDGLPHIDIDEYMKHRLQAKLTEAIVGKK